jgi:hypothetical protein
MRKVVFWAGIGLILAGCGVRGTGEQFMSPDQIEAKDLATCQSLGARPGTQSYIDCRLRLRSDRSYQDTMRRYGL